MLTSDFKLKQELQKCHSTNMILWFNLQLQVVGFLYLPYRLIVQGLNSLSKTWRETCGTWGPHQVVYEQHILVNYRSRSHPNPTAWKLAVQSVKPLYATFIAMNSLYPIFWKERNFFIIASCTFLLFFHYIILPNTTFYFLTDWKVSVRVAQVESSIMDFPTISYEFLKLIL